MSHVREFVNTTISAPAGTSQHGEENFICFPADWSTVLKFFVANYLAHAFTIWKRPGEKSSEYAFAIFLAFLFPVSGLARGIDAIYRHAAWQGASITGIIKGLFGNGSATYEMNKAAKAGALAIVVRKTSLEHQEANNIQFAFEQNPRSWDRGEAILFGNILASNFLRRLFTSESQIMHRIVIPDAQREQTDLIYSRNIAGYFGIDQNSGYSVIELPHHWSKEIKTPPNETAVVLAQSSNILQIFLAIAQIIYSSYSIALNTGDQFRRYGYTAFALTVVPYTTMSFINLLGNLFTPVYDTITLIRSNAMEEATSRGSVIEGAVGKLLEAENETLQRIKVIPYRWNARASAHELDSSQLHHQTGGIPVCFTRDCHDIQTHHVITVPSGQPKQARASKPEYCVKSFGFLCGITLPIAIMVYIAQSNSATPISLERSLSISIWLAVGDLLGLYLVWSRVGYNSLWDVVFLFEYFCAPKKRSRKVEGYLKENALRIIRLFILMCVGLTAVGFNFYFVIIDILQFGNCDRMAS